MEIKIGDVIMTKFGFGIVREIYPELGHYQVRLPDKNNLPIIHKIAK